VCAVTPGNVAEAGCAIASQVLGLQVGSLAGIYEGIMNIAAAIHRHAAGHRLIEEIQSRLQAVRVATVSKRRRSVVVLEWTDPVFAIANWGPELVEIANGDALLGNGGKHSAAIEWVEVVTADPELLIIAPCGFGLARARGEMDMMQRRPGWSGLRSVKEGRVAIADGNRYFNRSGTTVVETAEILADILHDTRMFSGGAGAWEWFKR
jgi:iron complex transport system substrate-binding protein